MHVGDGTQHHEEKKKQNHSGAQTGSEAGNKWPHGEKESRGVDEATPSCARSARLSGYSQPLEERLFGSNALMETPNDFFTANRRSNEDDCVRIDDSLVYSSVHRSGQSFCDYHRMGNYRVERYSHSEDHRSLETQFDQNRSEPADFIAGLYRNSGGPLSLYSSRLDIALNSMSEQPPIADRPTASHDLSPVSIPDRADRKGMACASPNDLTLRVNTSRVWSSGTDFAQASLHSVLTNTPGEALDMPVFPSFSELGSPYRNTASVDEMQQAQKLQPTLSGIVMYDGQLRGRKPLYQAYGFQSNPDGDRHDPGLHHSSSVVFILYGILLASVINVLFLVFNDLHHEENKLCNAEGRCPCLLTDVLKYVVTYGLHVYVPFALFPTALFFLTINSITEDRERKRRLARMHCYVTSDDISQHAHDNVAGDDFEVSEPYGTRNESAPTRALRWDLPPALSTLASNIIFWVVVLIRFGSFSVLDTRVVRPDKLAFIYDAGLVLALSAPLAAVAKYHGCFRLVVPFMLLDAFPLLSPPIIAPIKVDKGMEHIFHPLLLVVIERMLWYLSAAVMPETTPVGVKITLSSSFAAIYTLFVLTSAVSLPYDWWLVVSTVMAVEIFIFEMLFNTLLLEFTALRLFTVAVACVKRQPPQVFSIKVSDPVNISTQVRWPSLALALCGVSPVLWLPRWDRVLPQSCCDGLIARELVPFVVPFILAVTAFTLSYLLTAMIRMRYDRLRAPLIARDWFLALMWGWYVTCTVPFALSALM
ncbi:uncharacterized protein TEOVI_000211500 [Trypanosoma equiperdum]|uniref:Transmembrane protein n=2 Tax=Trypanozoon TaxID=39700 RepID=Q586Y5_TRYB2|nr:hypothetical protein, conserved [Trypanosoma brucei brucei TREU927]AAQ15796.1 hypothetical protein, conserved [Trypanosoma brucei brucei TREU927]AAX79606.1 hypothetical protein, conserved [Trypanosoma brucei]SCU70541.1 hypothetical protein, conserved [Trypanosoma equiperdum]